MRDTILTESVYIQKENVAVSKAVLRVYSYIGQHPLTLNDAILRNADVLDRHFNKTRQSAARTLPVADIKVIG